MTPPWMFHMRSRPSSAVADVLKGCSDPCGSISPFFKRLSRLNNESLAERVCFAPESAKHDPEMILLRDHDVDITPRAAHQMKAPSELIKFGVPIKYFLRYLLSACKRKCQKAEGRVATAPKIFHRLVQRDVHRSDQRLLAGFCFRITHAGIAQLLVALTPWNPNCNQDRDDAADRLPPCSPYFRLQTRGVKNQRAVKGIGHDEIHLVVEAKA